MTLASLAFLYLLASPLPAAPPWSPASGVVRALVAADETPEMFALDEYVDNLRRTPSWGRLAVTYFGDDALNLLGRAHKE